MCSNMPASPAYGAYISQLIRYARVSSNYSDFLERHIDRKIFLTMLLTTLSLYIFTIWKSIVYNLFCRDGIYFDKILVSKYKLFKRSNKANLFSIRSWNSISCKRSVFDIYFTEFGTALTTIFQICAAIYQLLMHMVWYMAILNLNTSIFYWTSDIYFDARLHCTYKIENCALHENIYHEGNILTQRKKRYYYFFAQGTVWTNI
jgi:hypothetical protein